MLLLLFLSLIYRRIHLRNRLNLDNERHIEDRRRLRVIISEKNFIDKLKELEIYRDYDYKYFNNYKHKNEELEIMKSAKDNS